MRLRKVKINGYKHLKNISVEMGELGNSSEGFPVKFLIGLNGTGKSAFLEAVALIFSRISQDELPGFWFEIEYTVFTEKREMVVNVRPEEDRAVGRLHIEIDGQVFRSFEKKKNYLPYKIITYVSGPNSQMEQLLGMASKNSLLSDIWDAGEKSEGREEIDQRLRSLAELGLNPRSLFLDEKMAVLALFVIFAWKPEADEEYLKLREEILHKIGNSFVPAALSLKTDSGCRATTLFSELFYDAREVYESGAEKLYDWLSENESGRTAVYLLGGKTSDFCAEALRHRYPNPLQLLTVLLQGRKDGAMKECHMFFYTNGSKELLDEKSLSDGELLWAARMGLVLLARHVQTNNCLFLFDEPDVHLNENWNVDFVLFLKELSGGTDGDLHHEFLVSTHSSLLLTDALPSQIYLFQRSGQDTQVTRARESYFGADRGNVSQQLFETAAEEGNYSKEVVEKILREVEEPQVLKKHIDRMGPGYLRFCLMDKYFDICKG